MQADIAVFHFSAHHTKKHLKLYYIYQLRQQQIVTQKPTKFSDTHSVYTFPTTTFVPGAGFLCSFKHMKYFNEIVKHCNHSQAWLQEREDSVGFSASEHRGYT